MKNGELKDGATDPEKPALHVQPECTKTPEEPGGHCTSLQTPVKNGSEVDATISPESPASHAQPPGTSGPEEPLGHGAALQAPVKNGELLA